MSNDDIQNSTDVNNTVGVNRLRRLPRRDKTDPAELLIKAMFEMDTHFRIQEEEGLGK